MAKKAIVVIQDNKVEVFSSIKKFGDTHGIYPHHIYRNDSFEYKDGIKVKKVLVNEKSIDSDDSFVFRNTKKK